MKVSYRTHRNRIRKPRDLHLRHSDSARAQVHNEGLSGVLLDLSFEGHVFYDRPSDIRELADWLHRAADYIEEQRNHG